MTSLQFRAALLSFRFRQSGELRIVVQSGDEFIDSLQGCCEIGVADEAGNRSVPQFHGRSHGLFRQLLLTFFQAGQFFVDGVFLLRHSQHFCGQILFVDAKALAFHNKLPLFVCQRGVFGFQQFLRLHELYLFCQ